MIFLPVSISDVCGVVGLEFCHCVHIFSKEVEFAEIFTVVANKWCAQFFCKRVQRRN
jgi:hypothetical protein